MTRPRPAAVGSPGLEAVSAPGPDGTTAPGPGTVTALEPDGGTATEAAGDRPVRVLAVCTGNICRSALAHAYLARRLEEVAPGAFVVASAGTHHHDQLVVPPEMHRVARAVGVELDSHRGRYLTPALVREADLILTATAEHRRRIVRESPDARRRTLTVLEFAGQLDRLALRLGPSRDAALSAIERAARGSGAAAGDVPDPYGGPPAAYDEMAGVLLPALDVIVAAAAPPTP